MNDIVYVAKHIKKQYPLSGELWDRWSQKPFKDQIAYGVYLWLWCQA